MTLDACIRAAKDFWLGNRFYIEKYVLKDGKKHPFALICPGGGYNMVCSFVEGRPYAQELNKKGYSAFVVHYRCKSKGRFPAPQEDVVRALKYVLEHAEDWNLETEGYSLWGASAGGHLAACMGTEAVGFSQYGLPNPETIVLSYPVVTMGERTHLGSRENLLGVNATKTQIDLLSVEKLITSKYSATFVWYGDADKTVDPVNSKMLVTELEKNKITYIVREYAGVDHGVGLGKGLACEGWFDDAVAFWEEQRK